MNHSIGITTFFRGMRIPAACLLAAAAICTVWAGFAPQGLTPSLLPSFLAGGSAAVAGTSPSDPAVAPHGIDADAALYLRSSVDAAALALGGALGPGKGRGRETERAATEAEEARRKGMLTASLDDLTFRLGGSAYFTAWQGTRIIYSPMSPDAEGMDFADALDAGGVAFVRRMEEAVQAGGGFVGVLLPRAPAGREGFGPAVCGTLAPDDFEEALDGDAAAPHGVRACGGSGNAPRPVEQVLYARPVPHSNWHIAAFMPLDGRGAFGGGQKDGAHLEASPSDALMQRGLRLSGLSLAGLAGLLLLPGAAGRRE